MTNWWLPVNASASGASVDRLFVAILIVTGIVFVAVEATLIWLLIRFRGRNGRKAVYTHGNAKLEILWTLVPTLILLILGVASRQVWAGMKSSLHDDVVADRDAFQVVVRPQQFQWNITYPGPDGKLGTADDIQTINQLHVPVDRNVVVRLRSMDVIHSFFLPQMRVKQDALPNYWARVRFRPILTGNWEIVCAELCGLAHYRMRGYFVVQPQRELDAWLAEQARTPVR
jgi:cytochrome c oxidase subunit 2